MKMRPLILEPEYRDVLIRETIFTTGRIRINGLPVWGGGIPGVRGLLEDRARWELSGPTTSWRRSR